MPIQSRSILDKELNKLNDDILRLTSMVEEAIEFAIRALIERNSLLAEQVITNDQHINLLRYELENDCLQILATQQPAAGDLRTVLSAMHITIELERMGDHAAGIAALVKRLETEDAIESLHKLPKMAKRGIEMIRTTISAFIRHDAQAAHAVIDMDKKVDKQYRKLFRQLLPKMTDDDYIRRATYLLWVGHGLERIGDRATNIAERVIFMVTGKYVEIDPYDPTVDDMEDEDDDDEE